MLRYEGKTLYFGDKTVSALASEVGTPVFIASEAQLLSNFQTLNDGFLDKGVRPLIRYCAKTNNEAHVLSTLASTESQIMVSHDAEAELALNCGFPPDKIAYQRPIFIEDEVCSILRKGIPLIHIYRYQDVTKIASLALELHTQVQVSLRLGNLAPLNRLHPVNFPATRLGMNRDELIQAARLVESSSNLTLRGINFYAGTQKGSPDSFKSMIRKVMMIASKLNDLRIQLPEINVGGGIPSNSLARIGFRTLFRGRRGARQPDARSGLYTFGMQLAEVYKSEWERAGRGSMPVLVLEPGRSLVANTTIILTRIKAIQGNWLFLDASSNYLGESPLLLWRQVLPVELQDQPSYRTYHLSGSSLNTLDVLAYFRRLPELHEGDLLILGDAGAYSISRASRYAGLSPAIYVLGKDGTLKRSRRPEDYQDLSAAMVIRE